MSQHNKYKRLGINTTYTFIGSIGSHIISFILLPFYTYWLTKEDFGIQDLAQVYWVLVIPYLSLGLYEAVFIFPKGKEKQEQKEYLSTALFCVTLMIIFALCVFLLLPQSIIDSLFPQRMGQYVKTIISLICIGVYQRIIQNFARGIDKMKVFSITGILYAVILCVLSLLLVPNYQLDGYFISLLSAQVISIIYTFIAIKGWEYTNIHVFIPSRLLEMIKYSLPLIPNTTMWWIVNSINRPLLLSYVGLDGIGLYAVAHKFPSIVNIFYTIFFSAMQISVLEEFGKKGYSYFYNNVLRVLIFIQFLITFGFLLGSHLIFRFFVDSKFSDGANYVPIMCVAVIITNLSTYVGLTFTALKQTKYFLYSSIIAATVAILFNFTLIPKYGIMGACLAVCISQLSMFIYRWYKSYKHVNFVNGKKLSIILSSLIIPLMVFYIMPYSWMRLFIISIFFCIFLWSNADIMNFIFLLIKKKNRHF